MGSRIQEKSLGARCIRRHSLNGAYLDDIKKLAQAYRSILAAVEGAGMPYLLRLNGMRERLEIEAGRREKTPATMAGVFLRELRFTGAAVWAMLPAPTRYLLVLYPHQP